jgi:hypothetical protein
VRAQSFCFLTVVSTPPNPLAHVTPRRLCLGGSGLAQLRLKSAQVCSPISPEVINLYEEPGKAPFPSHGSQICSYCTLIPRQLSCLLVFNRIPYQKHDPTKNTI